MLDVNGSGKRSCGSQAETTWREMEFLSSADELVVEGAGADIPAIGSTGGGGTAAASAGGARGGDSVRSRMA
jgi:hypothetical protein